MTTSPAVIDVFMRVARRFGRSRAGLWLRLRRAGIRVSSLSGPGSARFAGLVIRYSDPLVLYIEHKDIFGHEIYGFECADDAPRILDCGGHFGLATLYFKSQFPKARITTFEPDPSVLPLLRENLASNGYNDVEIVPCALADSAGPRQLTSALDGSRLVADFGGSPQSATLVEAVRLSDFLTDPVDFVKMNIEGAELAVLKEAQAGLGTVDKMVIEYHGFADVAQYLHELLGLLDNAGFRYGVHDFDAETNAVTKPPFFTRPFEETFFLLVFAGRSERTC